MSRRSLSLTLLAILAVQMFAGVVMASVCLEPCPDDAGETSCPPVCTLCTSCTHSKSAIVRDPASGAPLIVGERYLPVSAATTTSPRASDIFHVPLQG